jgi:DNA-binding response OmpR family regulator
MRLLLVEDDEELTTSLRRDLEQAGYAVDIAATGVEGEYMGDEGTYDIAILDLGLPDRNGLDVLRNWRARSNPLPVIILTARHDWQERIEGFQAGADDYVGKPFYTEELIARIKALINRSQGQQPGSKLQGGGLKLDEETREVITEDGNRQMLTNTEFRLLRYLLLNPDKVLSKSTLTEHVYDFDSDKDSNVIEVYIKYLRDKIGKDKIETRRGQGYVFRGKG